MNIKAKPYALIHGTYQVEPERVDPSEKKQYKKIHCVYAGTFDPRKGGARMAVEAARWLPENYHVHILGGGRDKVVADVWQLITEVSAQTPCTVTYNGYLSGETFTAYLQKCQIGLSTQKADGAFVNTSFPSKILMYLSNGLQVVTAKIPVVQDSAVSDMMHYYEGISPESIAKAILSVDVSDISTDARKCIAELDEKFTEDIKSLIERT